MGACHETKIVLITACCTWVFTEEQRLCFCKSELRLDHHIQEVNHRLLQQALDRYRSDQKVFAKLPWGFCF